MKIRYNVFQTILITVGVLAIIMLLIDIGKKIKNQNIISFNVSPVALKLIQKYPREDKIKLKMIAIPIEIYSKQYKIEWEWIAAIIQTESNFNYFATGNKGEQGIAQIMPDTKNFICSHANIPNLNGSSFNVQYAIQMCCWYLAYIQLAESCEMEKAIRIYNVGLTNWRKGKIDGEAYFKKVYIQYQRLKT